MRIIQQIRFSLMLALLSAVWMVAAAETAVDHALYWSISDTDGHKGYLLGTIHSEDPRVLDFSEDLLDSLTGSRVFAMELVPDLKTLARLTDFMHLPEESSLEAIIGERRFGQVAAALASYGVPTGQVNRMKPWAAMMTLSVPPPETGFFMDFSLSLRASGGGLKVIGLETLEQQLAFLERMPLGQQMLLLDHAVAEFGRVREVHDLMVGAYLDDDLDALARLAEEQLESLDAGVSSYFMKEGIDRRNQRMLESLLPVLPEGGVFTAVGALHLPGEHGLLNMLRENGYSLQPLGLPLKSPQ